MLARRAHHAKQPPRALAQWYIPDHWEVEADIADASPAMRVLDDRGTSVGKPCNDSRTIGIVERAPDERRGEHDPWRDDGHGA